MGITVEYKYPKQVVLDKDRQREKVSRDRSLGCEKRSWVYIFAVPFMLVLVAYVFLKTLYINRKVLVKSAKERKKEWKVPNTNTLFFDGLSRPLRAIKDGAASWRALDLIYNYFEEYRYFHPEYYPNGLGTIERLLADFWIGMMNAQAVRNRRKYVADQLAGRIKEVFGKEGVVRIFSIASGSAQAVFEAILKSGVPQASIRIKLLDIDQTALDYSYALAEKMGLKIRIDLVRLETKQAERIIRDFNPHIIEMVGFLDYRPDERAVELFKRIHSSLMVGGYFVTANVCPNAEMGFLKWIINWKMIYRSRKVLEKLLKEGEFNDCDVFLEPQKIHAIAIARRW